MTEIELLQKAQRRRGTLQNKIRERRNSIGDDDSQTRAWQRQLEREAEHIARCELLLLSSRALSQPAPQTRARSSNSAPVRLNKPSSKHSTGAVSLGGKRSSTTRRSTATCNTPDARALLALRGQWDAEGRPVSGRLYQRMTQLVTKLFP